MMIRIVAVLAILLAALSAAVAQSRNSKTYSESVPTLEVRPADTVRAPSVRQPDDETIRVDTELVIVPTHISERSGRAVTDVRRGEFRLFEDGVEQEIAYFAAEDQPFTVAILLDMSYSSVFKLEDIQNAALAFIRLLRPEDKVMIIAFDEKVRILCRPTNNRYALRLAVEAAKIGSGTSFYDAIGTALSDGLSQIKGRKAIVMLSDGVDTTSVKNNAAGVIRSVAETDVVFYPVRYDTFEDVQKTRQNQAEIRYDEDDRPYQVIKPRVKGEREEDYRAAAEFARAVSSSTAGRVFDVSSTTNLGSAFRTIADELRRVYTLGYYPSGERKVGVRYAIKVRVYRPDLVIRARSGYRLGQ